MALSGKLVSGGILTVTAAFGIGVYYAQIYGYYDTFSEGEVALTSVLDKSQEIIPLIDFDAIDADSSPIRYRSCFKTTLDITTFPETF